MNTKSLYTIPGETNVRDNNWKEIMKEVNIQPRSVIEKADWKIDAVALASSPEVFVARANTWPSSLRNNRNQYFLSPGKDEDFYGPLASTPFTHGMTDWGIKIPPLSGEKETEDFALYTRMIHKYCRNVDTTTTKYSNERATMKATMNVALLMATVESRCGQDFNLQYTQSDNTTMSEICGLIGKKTDGTDMTDKEQALFISNLADNYIAQIHGRSSGLANVSDGKTYGDYKKEQDSKNSKEINEQIDKMSPAEQKAMLAKLLSQRN